MNRWGCVRCDWQPTADAVDEDGQAVPGRVQLTEHAESSAHPLCPCCARSLSVSDPQFACETCLTLSQGLLSGIVTMFLELPRHRGKVAGGLVRGGGASDGMPLPGGDVLVLSSAGSPGFLEDGLTSREGDPQSVAFELGWWASDWSERHNGGVRVQPDPTDVARQPVRRRPSPAHTVLRAAGYLERRARWAAGAHSGFPQYLNDLNGLHHRLERATGRALRNVRAQSDCFDCGAPLVRLDDPVEGVSEVVTCRRCRQSYDPVRYRLALKAAVFQACQAMVDGVQFATPTIVAAALGRSERTIRDWERRQLIRRHVLGGIVLVCLEDAEREAAERGVRRRVAS